MKEYRRTLEGQLVSMEKQLRMTFVFVGGGILAVAALSLFLMNRVRDTIIHLDRTSNMDPELAYPLMKSLEHAQIILGLGALSLFIFAVWRGFRLSHRIWGPSVPLRRHVGHLIEGRFDVRVKLREGDEFEELAQDLNRLAESLEKRHG